MNIVKTEQAPAAIGTYSQAVSIGDMVFLSGQIGLDPATMKMISSEFTAQAHQVFKNLSEVIKASGFELTHIAKLNVYLKDLNDFEALNSVMETYIKPPFPARAAVEVSRLPKDALIEIDAILMRNDAKSASKTAKKEHSKGFLSLVEKASQSVQQIEANEVKQLLAAKQPIVLIDVRENHEWQDGHADSAIHLSKGIIERDIEKTVPSFDTNIVLYCSGGYRSILAAEQLIKMGYNNVKSLIGGYQNW